MFYNNFDTHNSQPQVAPNVGLVFSGGGGKGAYEIGAWRALEEYGVAANIGAISGTSVGALNAALFAQGSLACAEDVWQSISPDAILTPHSLWRYLEQWFVRFLISPRLCGIIRMWFHSHLSQQGYLSQDGLSTLIRNHVDLQRIRAFGGPVYAAAYNISKGRLDYFDIRHANSIEELESMLLASASIPLVFGETTVNECQYVDGGIPIVGDNTPVKPLYAIGIRKFVVIHLSHEEPVDRSLYPDSHIIEIMPQEDLGGIFGGTLNFKAEQAQKNMQRGYEDTCRILAPLLKIGEAQTRSTRAMSDILKSSHQFQQEYIKYQAQYEEDAQAVQALLSKFT